VQGVAEVLPVSSSAQLSLLPWLLRWDAVEDRTSFAAGLHAGSALGIAAALRPTPRELGPTLAATLPAAVAGAVLHEVVERRLGRPGPTAALLAGAGVALALADRRPSSGSVQGRDLALAGTTQLLALAPGVSRAGITITTLRLRSVRRQDAFRTSLVMSLPVTLGAAGLTAWRSHTAPPALPAAVAALASYQVASRVSGASSRVLPAAALYRVVLAGAVGARLRSAKEN
jgi:undecaprenyl-diphosphatase